MDSLKKNEESVIKEVDKINYDMGMHKLYGYDECSRMSIHEIEKTNIESALEKDFDEVNEGKRDNLKEQIETKKLDIIEKILFADEKELLKLIGELNDIRIEL